MATYFNSNGKMITDKFDEFIDMIEDFEERERKRPQKEIETNLLNQIKEALISAREKEIDKLADKFDAIAEANNRMVDAIQNWVDEERRLRQNEETEKDISDKYSQLAYLGMDTSGSSTLEALALQKETEQLERDYQDSLID
jgi:activator of 2-hydroxyglutaryl-CoA dehydratase